LAKIDSPCVFSIVVIEADGIISRVYVQVVTRSGQVYGWAKAMEAYPRNVGGGAPFAPVQVSELNIIVDGGCFDGNAVENKRVNAIGARAKIAVGPEAKFYVVAKTIAGGVDPFRDGNATDPNLAR
jgi:hypothetical protein